MHEWAFCGSCVQEIRNRHRALFRVAEPLSALSKAWLEERGCRPTFRSREICGAPPLNSQGDRGRMRQRCRSIGIREDIAMLKVAQSCAVKFSLLQPPRRCRYRRRCRRSRLGAIKGCRYSRYASFIAAAPPPSPLSPPLSSSSSDPPLSDINTFRRLLVRAPSTPTTLSHSAEAGEG